MHILASVGNVPLVKPTEILQGVWKGCECSKPLQSSLESVRLYPLVMYTPEQ